MLNKTARKVIRDMTNQDEKLNEEIWEEEEISSVELIDFNRESRLMNKARQQGIDNTIIECEKKKELWIDRERKSVYEQGRKDGIEAERKRIIEMVEKVKQERTEKQNSLPLRGSVSWCIIERQINTIKEILSQLKNSEAMEK
jgi:hypothetical protein